MATGFSIRPIMTITDGQLNQAVELCIGAYGPDIAIKSMVWGDESLKYVLFRAMIRATLLAGTVYIATPDDDEGKIVAMTLWHGPGAYLFRGEEQRNLGYYDFRKGLSPEGIHWWDKINRPTMAPLIEKSLGKTGGLDSWFLNLIVTSPRYQRRGIAKALLDIVYQEALKDGSFLALCCTNDLNERIYQSVGFTTVGRTDMVGYGDEGFPVYCLVRKA